MSSVTPLTAHIARRAADGRAPTSGAAAPMPEASGLTIRAARPGDRAAIRRVAERDSRAVPQGPVLVAQIGGEIVAALPLDGGPAVADPFRPTAPVLALLELRARQLRSASSLGGRLLAGGRNRGRLGRTALGARL